MRVSIRGWSTARRTLRRRGILALAAAAGIYSIGAPAGAASLTWDGGDATHNALFGGNGTWDLATPNWDNGAADVPWTDVSANGADVAVFNGAPGTVTLNTNLSALGLQFLVPNYTVAGTGTLTLGASGVSAGTLASATTTVAANVALAANQQWNVGAGATLLQQTGVVSGAGGLTAAGPGTVTLNGANTFTGALTVNSGVVQTNLLGITTAAQGMGKSNALNLNGGTFRYTGANFNPGGTGFAPTITVGAAGGTMNITGGFVFFGGTYAGGGTLTVINSNNVDAAWILQTSASPSFAGNIVLGNGVGNQSGLQVRGGGTNPLGTGTVTVNAGGLLTVDTVAATVPNNLVLNGGIFGTQSVAATYTGDITLQSNSFIGSPPHIAYNSFNSIAGAISVNGLIHGAAGLTKVSGDTATFNVANTYTGPTFVRAGTLVYAADESALTGLTTINNGATLQLSPTGAVAPAFNVALNGGTLNVVAAAAGSDFNVPATWTPGGAERNYKSTYGTSGTANLNFPAGFATRAAGTVNNFVLSGGTAGTAGSPGTPGTNNITIAGQAAGFFDQGTFFNGGTSSANYAYYDGGGFLRGINWGVDSGSTTAAGGASLASATFARTTAAVTAQASATFTGLNIVNTTATAQAFTLASGATVQTNGILRSGNGGTAGVVTVSGGTGIQPATTNAELVIRADSSGDPLTITTPIIPNGTNAVTKSGNGTLVLGAANTYTGNTNVNAGVVQITVNTAIPANTTTVVNPGGTFDFAGQNISANGRPFTVSGPGSPTSYAALVNTSSAEATVGAVTLTGDTTVGQTTTKLNFGSTLNGGGFTLTTVTNGTGAGDQTDIRAANALSNLAGVNVFDVFRMEASQNWTGTITINNGGTVDTFNTVTMNPSIRLLNGGKLSIGGGSSTWTGGTVTLIGASTIDTAGGTMTINHTISGTGSFTKTSANTLTLGGNNTFTTPITVNAGAVATGMVGAPTAAQGIGQSGALVLNGGTFRYTGASNGSDAGTTAGTNFAPTITVGASGGTLDNSGAPFIFYNGSLVGSGSLAVVDSTNANHQWLVAGSSPTFSGNVTVGTATANSAFLQYRSNNPLPFGTGTITVQAGGTVAADNGATNPSTLGNNFVLSGGILGTQAPAMTYTGGITITATSSVGHVANGAGTVTLAGVVSGAGGLNVIGGSTVTLSNANTYLGPTSIAAPATLVVSGSGTTGGPASTATVTVPQGAFLNLAVAGIQAGQTLQITNSGSTPEVTLASGVNDTIATLILGDGTNTFTLPPGTYGSTSSPAASDANITAVGLNPNSFFAGTGIVTVTTPEPASAALLALAGAGLLARRRRRRA